MDRTARIRHHGRMESNEEFKRVVSLIKLLEVQLSQLDTRHLEQYGVEAEKEIKDHFAQCVNALAARQEKLLRELHENISKQRVAAVKIQDELDKAIDVRKKMLEVGSHAYTTTDTTTAEAVWKSVSNLPLPQQHSVGEINVELSSSLLQAIQSHGTVFENKGKSLPQPTNNLCRYEIAESVEKFVGSMELAAGFSSGKGTQAKLTYPWGICFNPYDHRLYFCEFSSCAIRMITLEGEVSTFVTSSLLSNPIGIALHYQTQTFFVTNYGTHTIAKITSSGDVSVLAGSGLSGAWNGFGSKASFNEPRGIAIDQQTGNLYVCDCMNSQIRKITPQGEVSTIICTSYPSSPYSAGFSQPWGILFDETDQSLLVCDYQNSKLKRVSLHGVVWTVCNIESPSFIVAPTNDIFLVSSYNARKLYQVNRQGIVTEIKGANGNSYTFTNPTGLATHEASRSCFVSEHQGHCLSKITFLM